MEILILLSSHLKTAGGGVVWLMSCVHPAPASGGRWTESHSIGMTVGMSQGCFWRRVGLVVSWESTPICVFYSGPPSIG